jgi:hypothetical protein
LLIVLIPDEDFISGKSKLVENRSFELQTRQNKTENKRGHIDTWALGKDCPVILDPLIK